MPCWACGRWVGQPQWESADGKVWPGKVSHDRHGKAWMVRCRPDCTTVDLIERLQKVREDARGYPKVAAQLNEVLPLAHTIARHYHQACVELGWLGPSQHSDND